MDDPDLYKATAPEQNISPLSLDVYVFGVTGLTSSTDPKYLGTGLLKVDNNGMRIHPRKSGKTLIPTVKESYEVPWDELKEIKDKLVTKKRFHANFGKDKKGNDILVWIALRGESIAEAASLSAIFTKLGPAISMKKCPACGGMVENEICKKCGKNFKNIERQKGIRWLVGGIIVFSAGLILTISSEKSSSGGSSMTVYIGLLFLGVILAIFGIIKIISGRR